MLASHHRAIACACLLACLPLGGNATNEVVLQAGENVESVDNPFLFPNSSTDPRNRRDTVHSTDIGVAARVPLPSDRSFLAIGATASQQRYDNLTQLNRIDRQFDATYQWEYSHLLRGRVRHRFDERLYSYYGGFFTAPETPQSKDDLVEVALRITPELDIPLTVTQSSLRYDNPSLSQRYDLDDRGLQLALSYTSGRKSTFSAGVRQTEVNFPHRSAADIAAVDSGYTDREAFLDVAWRYSENTIVIGHLGTLDRSFASLSNRNTQLLSADLGLDWRYSPKTQIGLRLFHRPQSNEQADLRLYVVSTGIEGRVYWDATEKTRFFLSTSVESQKYQNFTSTASAVPGGRDRVVRVAARMEYAATPHLLMRVEAAREHYTPDPAVNSGGDFSRNDVKLGLSYTFENMQGKNRARTQLESMRYERVR